MSAELTSDIQKATREVKLTTNREDAILAPNTTWDDLGGMDSIRIELNLRIMKRIKSPELYQATGTTAAVRVLLMGPPGCGKTSIARAVANEAGINFLYITRADILNKDAGESEKNVRDLFKKAVSLAPCIIFFDEIDSIFPKRLSYSYWSEDDPRRVTNQFLLELSGLEQRNEVYIMAATNKLDCLDPELLRPGHMDNVIYVGLPYRQGRAEILKVLTKNGTRPKVADDVDLDCIGMDTRCDYFSGADMENLLRVAKQACAEQMIESGRLGQPTVLPVLNKTHFETAFESVSSSVDAEAKKDDPTLKIIFDHRIAKHAAAYLSQIRGHSRSWFMLPNSSC